MSRPSPEDFGANLVQPATPQTVAHAGMLLRAGRLVGMPTETVYGLAADATQGQSVARIFEVKGRPTFNPLICHIAKMDDALRHGHFAEHALRLAEAFWPGPLTLVVPARADTSISALARAGLDTIALRMPGSKTARAIISAAAAPIAAPSANLSGRVSPTTAAHVLDDLGRNVDFIVDDGPCEVGLESTVVICVGNAPALLRPGGVPQQALADAVGMPVEQQQYFGDVRSPGMLASHYAPNAKMQLNVVHVNEAHAYLGFGPAFPPRFSEKDRQLRVFNLSPKGCLREAAANLFLALRALDSANPPVIDVAPIPETGLGVAINDRLRRAAAPR